MSHIATWFFFVLAAVVCHAFGVLNHHNASLLIAFTAAALALHRFALYIVEISEVRDEEPPYPDLHMEFTRRYFTACETSQAQDWLQCALAAKRWESAVTKSLGRSA